MIIKTYKCDWCKIEVGEFKKAGDIAMYQYEPLNFSGFVNKPHICSECLAKGIGNK